MTLVTLKMEVDCRAFSVFDLEARDRIEKVVRQAFRDFDAKRPTLGRKAPAEVYAILLSDEHGHQSGVYYGKERQVA